MPGMLYYPFVNASPSAINQAVLYWDFLSTVVPDTSELRLSDSMRELADRGFYQPIEGTTIFSEDSGNNFYMLDQLAKELPLDDIIPPTKDSALESRTIYAAKLGDDLANQLVRRGLATLVQNDRARRWDSAKKLIVTPQLQTALMSIAIRQYVRRMNSWAGDFQNISLSPFTDEPFAFKNAHYPPAERLEHPQLRVEIGALLPSPRESVVIEELLRFREKYDDERRRLMFALELLLCGLSEHFTHPEDIIRAMKSEIETALKDFQEAAKSRKVTLVAKSLAAMIAIGSAAAASHLPDDAWVLGVIGGMAINVSTQTVRSEWRDECKYSYLYRVDRIVNG